jgi:3-dehydroquinate dehydratase-2
MADKSLKVLWLLHGVNLDMLGRRAQEHYGTVTLDEVCEAVRARALERGFEVRCFQSNHEGRMVEQLHALARGDEPVDAVVFNPGAWTHYSWAIHDALELVAAPVAEVHLSAVEGREEWRRMSVVADLAVVRVSGKRLDGYLEAVDRLAELVAGGPPS